MKKIIAVVVGDNGNIVYREGDEVPATAGLIEIGMPVKISNNNLLSNTTKGRISGFSVNYQKTLLAHVHWLDGAPPIRVNLSSIVSSLPKKFWMVAPDMESVGFSPTHNYNEPSLSAKSRGDAGPRKRYWDKQEAISFARSESVRFNRQYLILQAMVVCNADEMFAL